MIKIFIILNLLFPFQTSTYVQTIILSCDSLMYLLYIGKLFDLLSLYKEARTSLYGYMGEHQIKLTGMQVLEAQYFAYSHTPLLILHSVQAIPQ
jgi:hypothetical protein